MVQNVIFDVDGTLVDSVDDDGVDAGIMKPGIDRCLVGHAAIADAAALPFEVGKDERHE